MNIRKATRKLLGLLVLGIVVFAILVEREPLLALATRAQEDIMITVAPSAERYYMYGDRHFNSSEYPDDYDIVRAKYMYEHALALDPTLTYVNHQLARVAFIEGDLPKALTLINIQIAQQGDEAPQSYYVRGLIEGYMQNYVLADADYAHLLTLNPHSWAVYNDYSWILLKENNPAKAHQILTEGLAENPDNAWLLNSDAIALREMGSTTQATQIAARAQDLAENTSEAQWLAAYPGNDPATARQGLATFRSAVSNNMHTIQNNGATSGL